MASGRKQGEGKSDFVRDLLQRDPNLNEKSLNEAWKSAGNEGSISGTLLYNIRRDMGLSSKKSRADGADAEDSTAERSGSRPPSTETKTQRTARSAGAAPGQENGWETTTPTDKNAPAASESAPNEISQQTLDQIEDGIDELIFRLKGMGGRTDVVEALRQARRLLYQGQPH